MQPPARSAEAWRVFSLAQAPMLPDGRREHGSEIQQKEKISHEMNSTVKITEGRLLARFSPGLQRRR